MLILDIELRGPETNIGGLWMLGDERLERRERLVQFSLLDQRVLIGILRHVRRRAPAKDEPRGQTGGEAPNDYSRSAGEQACAKADEERPPWVSASRRDAERHQERNHPGADGAHVGARVRTVAVEECRLVFGLWGHRAACSGGLR